MRRRRNRCWLPVNDVFTVDCSTFQWYKISCVLLQVDFPNSSRSIRMLVQSQEEVSQQEGMVVLY